MSRRDAVLTCAHFKCGSQDGNRVNFNEEAIKNKEFAIRIESEHALVINVKVEVSTK